MNFFQTYQNWGSAASPQSQIISNPLTQWTSTNLVESYYNRPVAYDFASYLQSQPQQQQQQQYSTNTTDDNSTESPNNPLANYQQQQQLYGLENGIKREDNGLITANEETQNLPSATEFAMANAALLNQHNQNSAFSHLFRNPFNDPLMKGMVESAGQIAYPISWDQQTLATMSGVSHNAPM